MCLLNKAFENTVGKGEIAHNEQFLITSNFSFSHNVFYLFGELAAIFIKSKIVVCQSFEFGRVNVWEMLKETLTKTDTYNNTSSCWIGTFFHSLTSQCFTALGIFKSITDSLQYKQEVNSLPHFIQFY